MQEFKWMTFPFESVKNAPYLQTNWCSHLLTYKVNSSFNYIYILCLLHNCQKLIIKSNTLSDFKSLQIYKLATFANKVENFIVSYIQDFFVQSEWDSVLMKILWAWESAPNLGPFTEFTLMGSSIKTEIKLIWPSFITESLVGIYPKIEKHQRHSPTLYAYQLLGQHNFMQGENTSLKYKPYFQIFYFYAGLGTGIPIQIFWDWNRFF